MKVWFKWLTAICLCALLAAGCACAEQAKAKDVTSKCSFKVSEGSKSHLYDASMNSNWSYKGKDAFVGIKLPDGVQAGWLRVEWNFDPTGYELLEYDASQNLIQQRDQTTTFPNIYSLYPLLPETVYIQLKMTDEDQAICNLRVYSAGELPKEVQQWNPPVEKADLMLVSAHQDDELIFMGGTIPYYDTALKKPTIVVYMTNCTRLRRGEALDSLWKMGVKTYPEFINLRDKRVDSISEGVALWGGKDNILSLLVERIRRYKPEVIVTHDLDGEYGHNQHKITARAMMYAIEAAADPEQYPDSYQRYGEWQVKKLYHHLYKENALMMDWETPLDSLNGYSPLKVAKIGMNEQKSQLKYYAVKSHGTYDNAKFGLYFTTVGQDVAKNDFLEHIDPDASANWLAANAEALRAREAAYEEAGAPEEDLEGEGDAPMETAGEALEAPAEDLDGEADAPLEIAEEALDAPVEPGAEETAGDELAGDACATGLEIELEEPEAEVIDWVPVSDGEAANGGSARAGGATQTANERSGDSGTLFAALLGVGGVAAVGTGAWYAWRASALDAKKRRKKRRRKR